jgi:hypothetical protein
MLATLKKMMGEGGAGQDESHGSDRLYDVLKALAEQGTLFSATQATVAAAAIGGFVADQTTKLRSLWIDVAVAGTAGSTSVRARVNGTLVGDTATVANTDADGTSIGVDLDVEIEAGDLVEIVVTAAPTGGTGLTATLRMSPVTVE